jgi:hypothetical protein
MRCLPRPSAEVAQACFALRVWVWGVWFSFALRCVALLCGVFVRFLLALILAGRPFLLSLSVNLQRCTALTQQAGLPMQHTPRSLLAYLNQSLPNSPAWHTCNHSPGEAHGCPGQLCACSKAGVGVVLRRRRVCATHPRPPPVSASCHAAAAANASADTARALEPESESDQHFAGQEGARAASLGADLCQWGMGCQPERWTADGTGTDEYWLQAHCSTTAQRCWHVSAPEVLLLVRRRVPTVAPTIGML